MSSFTAEQPPSEKAIAHMKSSFRFENIEQVLGSAEVLSTRNELLADFARNAKRAPATASSGINLPYVLGLSASFMDPKCSRKIIQVCVQALHYIRTHIIKPDADEKVLIVGMEVAGGIMVSQLAALVGEDLGKHFNFVYMRKEKKKTGAAQQLEGIHEITDRTPETHPKPLRAIWVDDANSTGSSLTAGIATLAQDYNIIVQSALYVCDRSADRQDLKPERMFFARPEYVEKRVQVFALCDLTEIDVEVAKLREAESKQ
jgi:orotate phosphoribosyltransferase